MRYQKWLSLRQANESKTVKCERCPKGYKIKQSTCIGVCGDGMNLGSYECDDGNNVDGDGCSSDCNIEKGFKCDTQYNYLDICKDTVIPYGKLGQQKNDILEVTFNKKVWSLVPSKLNNYFRL